MGRAKCPPKAEEQPDNETLATGAFPNHISPQPKANTYTSRARQIRNTLDLKTQPVALQSRSNLQRFGQTTEADPNSAHPACPSFSPRRIDGCPLPKPRSGGRFAWIQLLIAHRLYSDSGIFLAIELPGGLGRAFKAERMNRRKWQ